MASHTGVWINIYFISGIYEASFLELVVLKFIYYILNFSFNFLVKMMTKTRKPGFLFYIFIFYEFLLLYFFYIFLERKI